KRLLKSIAYPVFLHRFDMFLPAGTRAAAFLRHYRVPEARIHIVPYCIDVDAFCSGARQAKSKREQIRAGWGASSEELSVFVVNEAFACGLPAIVSDRVGCAPDMVREGVTGRVVPIGDTRRLAHAIDEFGSRISSAAMSRALAEVTDRYSPGHSAEMFISAAA